MRRAMFVLAMAGVIAAPALAGGIVHPQVLESAIAVQAADAGDWTTADFPRAKQAVTDFLGLTPDQVTQWDALFVAHEAAVAPLRDQLQSTEAQIRDLLKGDNPDPGAVGTLVISGKTLREGIQAANATYLDGFGDLLTQDQKAKFGAVRRAARLAPLLPAFGVFGLLAPLPAPAGA